MSELDRRYSSWAKLGFALLIASTSLDVFYKYLGVLGILAYLVFCILLVFSAGRFDLPARLDQLSKRSSWIGAVTLFVFVIALVLLAYPVVNGGSYGAGGSDADDALIIGARELINGRYPFYPLTYLGNPIAPMPGSIFLAIPFVFLNVLPLQNIFWLAVLFVLALRELKSTAYAASLTFYLVFFSPAVLLNLVTSIDRLSNTIYILAAMWMLIRWLPRSETPWGKAVLPSLLLGVGLSSRSNFFLLIPVFFSFLVQIAGWKRSLKYLSISAAAFLLVTVPFWIYDPAGFTPFHEQSKKISQFEPLIPFAPVVVTGISILVAIIFAFRKMGPDGKAFLISCSLIQMFSILLLSAISSVNLGKADLYFGHTNYGVFALIFAAFAGWIAMREAGSHSEILSIAGDSDYNAGIP